MKSVDLSDENYARLERLAAAGNRTPAEMVTAWLDAEHTGGSDPLWDYLKSGAFSHLHDPADRYLALLAWVARHHAADFSAFVLHQASASRYLRLSRSEVEAVRRQHCARPIEGTHYWAVMDIEPTGKGRFVRRLLEFIGCPDETADEALHLMSLVPDESFAGQSR